MHKNFGEWYRLVSIERTDEILKKRWDGVEEWRLAISADPDAILETVRIFQGLPEKTSREAFLAAFRKHDAAFPQRNNELEQRVIAGATLVRCVTAWEEAPDEESKVESVRAAIIAGAAVQASGLRTSDKRLDEIARDVGFELQRLAGLQRKRTTFDRGAIAAKAQVAAEALKKIPAGATWDQFKIYLMPVFQHFVEALQGTDDALDAAARNVQRADEETNIVWWLEGVSSRDLNKPWSSLPKDAVPLIAGAELAALTDVALGPQDAAALLDRVVSKVKGKDATILTFVNAVPDEWLKDHADADALDLTPFSFALAQRAGSNASSWKSFFEASTGLKAATSFAPERVAQQAYIEGVLLRTLEGGED